MNRTYLLVPPEENAAVQALGARRDAQSKCWYIDSREDPRRFAKWLDHGEEGEEGEEFGITSGHAYVASTVVSCSRCQARFPAICIYCESGTVLEDSLTRFTVSSVWEMNDTLKRQLEPWPTFRWDEEKGCFANHCPHCHVPLDDLDLHSEPEQPFFNIPRALPGSVKLIPLTGPIQLSGSESFEI